MNQAPKQAVVPVEPFLWYRTARDMTDEYYTQFSDDERKPKGEGWAPLYTSPPSHTQGFAEAIEAAAKKAEEVIAEPFKPEATNALPLRKRVSSEILSLKPTTDTITISREELTKLLDAVKATILDANRNGFTRGLETLEALNTFSRALEGK